MASNNTAAARAAADRAAAEAAARAEANRAAAEKVASDEAAAKAAASKPAPAKPAPVAAPTRALAPISVTRWSEAAFKQARHSITPEAETPREHLLNPAYFAHIAPKVNAHDIIEVRPADGAFYMELYVWAKGSNWLHVSELTSVERPTLSGLVAADGKFSIEFVDGARKYRVVRTADRAELASGFETPALASAWLDGNKAKVAA